MQGKADDGAKATFLIDNGSFAGACLALQHSEG